MLHGFEFLRQLEPQIIARSLFINVVLEQPIPHLVCRQEVYLKTSVDWELVSRDVKGLDYHEIIRPCCPVSLLNEVLLRVIRDRAPKRTIAVRMGDKPWLDDRCVLAHRAKQRAYRAWSRSRTQIDWQEYRVARCAPLVCKDAERSFTERSKSLLTNAPTPSKWVSTVKAAVFGASSTLPPLEDRQGR